MPTARSRSSEPELSIAEAARLRSASRRKAAAEASLAALEAKVDSLQGDRLADRDKAEDSNDEIAQLRLAVSELRRDMVGVRESVDRVGQCRVGGDVEFDR